MIREQLQVPVSYHHPRAEGTQMPEVSQCVSPFIQRYGKVIVFTSPLLSEFASEAIQSAGIPCFALQGSMKPPAIRRVLAKFEVAESGVLLTVIGRPAGWRSRAGAMLFIQCPINLDRPQLAEALQSAEVQEIHYMNCLLTARNLEASLNRWGIVPVPSHRLFQPADTPIARDTHILAAS